MKAYIYLTNKINPDINYNKIFVWNSNEEKNNWLATSFEGSIKQEVIPSWDINNDNLNVQIEGLIDDSYNYAKIEIGPHVFYGFVKNKKWGFSQRKNSNNVEHETYLTLQRDSWMMVNYDNFLLTNKNLNDTFILRSTEHAATYENKLICSNICANLHQHTASHELYKVEYDKNIGNYAVGVIWYVNFKTDNDFFWFQGMFDTTEPTGYYPDRSSNVNNVPTFTTMFITKLTDLESQLLNWFYKYLLPRASKVSWSISTINEMLENNWGYGKNKSTCTGAECIPITPIFPRYSGDPYFIDIEIPITNNFNDHLNLKHQKIYINTAMSNKSIEIKPHYKYFRSIQFGAGNNGYMILERADSKLIDSMLDYSETALPDNYLSEVEGYRDLSNQLINNTLKVMAGAFTTLIGGAVGGPAGAIVGGTIGGAASTAVGFNQQQQMRGGTNGGDSFSKIFKFYRAWNLYVHQLLLTEKNRKIIERDREIYGDFINEIGYIKFDNSSGYMQTNNAIFNYNLNNFDKQNLEQMFNKGVIFEKIY